MEYGCGDSSMCVCAHTRVCTHMRAHILGGKTIKGQEKMMQNWTFMELSVMGFHSFIHLKGK